MPRTKLLRIGPIRPYRLLPTSFGTGEGLVSPRRFRRKPDQSRLQTGDRPREYPGDDRIRAAGRYPKMPNMTPDRGAAAYRGVGRPHQKLGRGGVVIGHVRRLAADSMAGMVKVTPSHRGLAGIGLTRITRDTATGVWIIHPAAHLFRSQSIT